MTTIRENIPESSLKLVKYSSKDLIDRLGKDIIAQVVESILCGENIRNVTEPLTQKRLLLMNASLLITYLRCLKSIENFEDKLPELVTSEAKTKKIGENVKCYLSWLVGLTGKSIENVVRNKSGYEKYLNNWNENLKEISTLVNQSYGNMNVEFNNDGVKYLMKWPSLLRCMLALGAQTLTIRGSEKSMYGKFFEKLVLGSALNLIGGQFIDKNDTSKKNMVYWLSQTEEEKREADATFIVRSGFGARFDIGFIGKGNSEVPADKLSRYERVSESGGRKFYSTTIVLIDKIGNKSNVFNIARRNNWHIIQMSGTYWLYELAQVMKEEFEFYDHPLLQMSKEDSIKYIHDNINNIDLSLFANGLEDDDPV